MGIDAVITELELQLESKYSPYGHFIALRFIDTYPTFPKINNTINEISKYEDVIVVNYNYTYEVIKESTDIKGLDVVKH
tara:strand:+ start:1649 stop:1885 length:237 start_codon:yes stop_codon:yes gene_type:complete